MGDSRKITYNYSFEDESTKSFTLSLDPQTLALISTPPVHPAPWTELDYHRCGNCTLSGHATSHCPLALNLSGIVEEFRQLFAYQSAHVEVVTPERSYAKTTTIQEGLSPLLGIVMTTSGCPIMEPLKPMVRFHLPFATLEETYHRIVSTWLMAQLFKFRKGETPDLSLEGIERMYADVTEVNRCIADRLRNTGDKDANLNAVVNLDLFASMAPMVIEDVLEQLEECFTGYF